MPQVVRLVREEHTPGRRPCLRWNGRPWFSLRSCRGRVDEYRDVLVPDHGVGVGEDGHVVRDGVAVDEIVVIVETLRLPASQSGCTSHTSSILRQSEAIAESVITGCAGALGAYFPEADLVHLVDRVG